MTAPKYATACQNERAIFIVVVFNFNLTSDQP